MMNLPMKRLGSFFLTMLLLDLITLNMYSVADYRQFN